MNSSSRVYSQQHRPARCRAWPARGRSSADHLLLAAEPAADPLAEHPQLVGSQVEQVAQLDLGRSTATASWSGRSAGRPLIQAIEPCVSRWACWTAWVEVGALVDDVGLGETGRRRRRPRRGVRAGCCARDRGRRGPRPCRGAAARRRASPPRGRRPPAAPRSRPRAGGSPLRPPLHVSASTATTRWPDEPHDVVEDVGVVGIDQIVGVDRGGERLPRHVLPGVDARARRAPPARRSCRSTTIRAWACGERSTLRCSMPSISVSIV